MQEEEEGKVVILGSVDRERENKRFEIQYFMPKEWKGQISQENCIQRPLAEICPAVWTRSLRGKVDGLEALQDLYEGPFANLLFFS